MSLVEQPLPPRKRSPQSLPVSEPDHGPTKQSRITLVWSSEAAIPATSFEHDIPDAIAAELRLSSAARTLAKLRAIAKAPAGVIAIPRPANERNEIASPYSACRPLM